jgi:glucose/arabinose dehydrogenase
MSAPHAVTRVERRRVVRSLVATGLVALLAAGCAGLGTTPRPSGAASPGASGDTASSATAPAGPSEAPSDGASPTAAPSDAFGLEVVASGLEAPLDLAWRPSTPDDTFVVEQVGRIRIVREGQVLDPPFLDISGIVTSGGERGLLGLAFHPDPSDPRFFVYYTGLDGSQNLASYEVSAADPGRADPETARLLLTMPDQFGNHNGGSLAYGPDGFLYVGTGDGGGGGDPLGSGRSLATLLAKVLRLDVDVEDAPYGIPDDNPFRSTADARPEIFLTGLRNPWRFRFDAGTGDLWIGDVGQGAWEEIDVVRAGQSGLDFGWNTMEGTHCYREAGCDETGLVRPVTEYGHDQGCSVTGGTVYRGSAIPDLVGRYVFGDYCSGRMWTIAADGDGFRDPVPALASDRSISAIAAGPTGDVFVTDLSGGDVLRIVAAGS